MEVGGNFCQLHVTVREGERGLRFVGFCVAHETGAGRRVLEWSQGEETGQPKTLVKSCRESQRWKRLHWSQRQLYLWNLPGPPSTVSTHKEGLKVMVATEAATQEAS